MGKSKNLHNEQKKVYQNEKNLHKFLKKEDIKILEKVNNYFSNKIEIYLSEFVKKNIKYISYSVQIESFLNQNKKNLKNFSLLNSIEVLPFKNQFFLIFSSNFLSIFIDLLFGGRGDLIEQTDKKDNFTLTEKLINKKITDSIMNCFFYSFKKFFSLDIKYMNMKLFLNFKTPDFNYHEFFLINNFNFNIYDIPVSFSILLPLSIITKISEKKIISTTSTNNENKNTIHQNTLIEKNLVNYTTFKNIYNVELDIKFRIHDIFISYKKLNSLLIGDVLLIDNPNTVIGFLEDQPVFSGKYKRFNEKCIFFIEKFIDNSEIKKDKEHVNE
ncbi:hypothetical protein ATN01_00390 [Buchnera aphidicola (Diuraphis noxia)]|uniref:Flagellar motor switch protein FliM n=1 Tax=Buchnera aphidicola subsp. Diuraphis noxia TaxID=118101 RepID=A0A1B2H7X0_BUCDN|nr:FliM/FliN family flagellar motor switch protein [Buchnera aphidicola]ANZ22323.1 hypothetical protein ATN01_00390 [Buchnera aphidicola (Diuraphis noxia)]